MPPTADASQRRLALIVATSDYRDPTLHRLRAPGTDAEALAEVLGDPEIGAFDVQTLLNLPSHQLSRGIAQFCADSRPTDLLLLYISCHGVLDDRGRLYYATINTERRLLGATSVSAQWLNDQLEDCSARRQLLVLDCCHSGAFERGMRGDVSLALQERFGSRGRIVLTASRATEYSFEGEQVRGQGISSFFTAALVDGLRTGDADRDRDGFITVTELYEHVFERTRAGEARQTPALWTYGAEGNVLVARSPRGAVIAPVALPEDLQATLDSPRPRVRVSAVAELAGLLDGAEPGLALTARLTLERVAENDIPQVAAFARAALDAEPSQAAEQVRSDVDEWGQRLTEERARRQNEAAERAHRQKEDEERVRRQEKDERAHRQREEEQRVRRQEEEAERERRLKEEEQARQAAVERARRRADELRRKVDSPVRRVWRRVASSVFRRWVLILAVSVGIGGAFVLVTYVPRTTGETILGQLPAVLRSSCTGTTDTSAICRLTDGTIVFFHLFDSVTEVRADVMNGNEPAPDGTPCPPSTPAAGTSMVCRYAIGAETGVAAFSHMMKDPQRFYECRWSPDAHPLLRGVMSTADTTPQDWESLQSNWTRLAGMQ